MERTGAFDESFFHLLTLHAHLNIYLVIYSVSSTPNSANTISLIFPTNPLTVLSS